MTEHFHDREAATIGLLAVQRLSKLTCHDDSAWPDFHTPAQLKSRLLRALTTIQRFQPEVLGVSRSEVRHLATLVSCVASEDLARSGGLLGGSNDHYGRKLAVLPATVTTIFRRLKRASLVEPHNATANNRRSCHLRPDGGRDGRGYTLRPLVTRLDELEGAAARLEEDSLIFAALHFELRALLAQLGKAAEPLGTHSLCLELALLQGDLPSVRAVSQLPKLRELLQAALDLKAEIAQALQTLSKTAFSQPENSDQPRKKSRQHHTVQQIPSVEVLAWQGVRSGNRAPEAASSMQEARPARRTPSPQGAHGDLAAIDDLACGLTLAEAPIIFPHSRHHIPASSDHESFVIAASRLGQDLRINPRILAKSFEAMGIARTTWALLLTHERLHTGQILTSPAPYFNGMVSRAQAGQLDLDRSIWGLRAAVDAKRH